jgi:hypothetical protein
MAHEQNIIFRVETSAGGIFLGFVADRDAKRLLDVEPRVFKVDDPSDSSAMTPNQFEVFECAFKATESKAKYTGTIACLPERTLTFCMKKQSKKDPKGSKGRVLCTTTHAKTGQEYVLESVYADVSLLPPDLRSMTLRGYVQDPADKKKRTPIEEEVEVTEEKKASFDVAKIMS